MSTQVSASRAYVSGPGAFLVVLTLVALAVSCIHPDPDFSATPSSVIGSTLGGAFAVEILPAWVGFFTFVGRNRTRGLSVKLFAPALLFGLIESLVTVGSTVDPVHSEPADVFSIAGQAFAVSVGGLVVLLYLVQFAGRLLARQERAA